MAYLTITLWTVGKHDFLYWCLYSWTVRINAGLTGVISTDQNSNRLCVTNTAWHKQGFSFCTSINSAYLRRSSDLQCCLRLLLRAKAPHFRSLRVSSKIARELSAEEMDRFLKVIAGLVSMLRLELDNVVLRDSSMKILSALSSLQELTLWGCT